MNLKDIDSALARLPEFSKSHQSTAGHIAHMREEAIFTDGAIPARIKALSAALWGISARCEPCLKFYIRKARELGASEAELNEILGIALAMGGCVGEMWAIKAYDATKSNSSESERCC